VQLGEYDETACNTRRCSMQKKYIVRLTKREQEILLDVIKKLQGTGQKVRRAQILLKANVSGPRWNDERIAKAFGCRRQTVEGIRQRFVESGFEETLEGKRRSDPAVEKLLNGKQEAQVIALRLGKPPNGYGNWTLRLLARRVVELKIAPAISHETVRRTLKK